MPNENKSWAVFFDHAAVATREPEKLKHVLRLLGLSDDGAEAVPSQGVTTHFLRPLASTPSVEILEVIDAQGVVAKFLDKKGPGIHHLSFQVTDIAAASEALKRQSVRLIYDAPKTGAHNARVNFIHPESTGGILIEISEKAL